MGRRGRRATGGAGPPASSSHNRCFPKPCAGVRIGPRSFSRKPASKWDAGSEISQSLRLRLRRPPCAPQPESVLSSRAHGGSVEVCPLQKLYFYFQPCFKLRSPLSFHRYVDTFNKGGGAPAMSFQSPSLPSAKPAGSAKFFIPTPVAAAEPTADPADASLQAFQGPPGNEDGAAPAVEPASALLSAASSSSSSTSASSTMQRFPSMDNISSNRNKGMGSPPDGNGFLGSRTRAASWSGTYPEAFNQKPSPAVKPPNGRSAAPVPSFFTPNNSPFPMNPAAGPVHANGGGGGGGGFGDDLQEVEL